MDDGAIAMSWQSLTQHTVADAVRGAGIDAPPRFVEVTGSTNSDLLRLAAEGASEWTVLVAGHQQAGRGRLGRSWVSVPGQSLLASVLLRPRVEAEGAPLLTLAAGLAMAEACREECGVPVRCKWPNDLMAGGRKLGGILAEAVFQGGRLAHVVVGAGVNLLQRKGDFPPELSGLATSVAIEGGRPDASPLLEGYLTRLKDVLASEDVVARYRPLSDTIGRSVRATAANGRTVGGVAEDVGPQGELLVRTRSGVEVVTFGEVVHLE